MNRFFAAIQLAVVPMDGSAANDETIHLKETVEINASVDRTWAAVGDFGDMSWHPAIGSTEVTSGPAAEVGATRVLTLKESGGKINETLNSYDATGKALSYEITESVLPVRDYSAALKVEAAGAGKSIVTWSAVFKRKDPANPAAAGQDDATAKAVVTGILQSGLQNLKQKVE